MQCVHRALLRLTLSLAPVAPAALAKSVEIAFNEEVFSLEVPPNAELQDVSPHLDFLRYDLLANGHRLMGIYVGTAPQTPNDGLQPLLIGGCEARSIERPGGGREVFVPLKSPSGFRLIVHFFYNGLPPMQANLADAVVSSLRPVRGIGCSR